MGIVDLWDIIGDSEAQEGRVTLSQFVVDHFRTHAAPPRVAVDGNLLLMGSGYAALNPEVHDAVCVSNFVSKLLALSALGISYIVVFDGRYKPHKIRHGEGASEYELMVQYARIGAFTDTIAVTEVHGISTTSTIPGKGEYEISTSDMTFVSDNYGSHDPLAIDVNDVSERFPLLDLAVTELTLLRIQHVFCPAEAEAQCAHWQANGVVDYVLTNDSDSFAFGATVVLKNMARDDSDEYSVTIYDMRKHPDLDRNKLVFVAALRGGDYSKGVRMFGSRRSVALATSSGVWTEKFVDCFVKRKDEEIDNNTGDDTIINGDGDYKINNYGSVRTPESRKKLLAEFSVQLTEYIELNAKLIFGMNFIPKELELSPNFPLFYLRPLVLDDAKFKFSFNNNCISNAIIEDETKFLWHRNFLKYPLKYLVVKLIQLSGIKQYLQITRDRLIGLVPSVMIKYEEIPIREHLGISREMPEAQSEAPEEPSMVPLSPMKSPSRKNYVWLPRVIVDYFNKNMIAKYDHQKSPSKQTTTLAHFKQFSPTKGGPEEEERPSKFQRLESIPKLTHTRSELSYSPRKKKLVQPIFSNFSSPARSPSRSPRKRMKKGQVLPGQKSVDTFFKKLDRTESELSSATAKVSVEYEEDNPFLESGKSEKKPLESKELNEYKEQPPESKTPYRGNVLESEMSVPEPLLKSNKAHQEPSLKLNGQYPEQPITISLLSSDQPEASLVEEECIKASKSKFLAESLLDYTDSDSN